VFDVTESGIAGVSVDVTGVDDLGAAVTLTTLTDAAGSYVFTDLRPGIYEITETQPAGFLDGLDSVGSLGGTLGADTVSGIPVASGDTGIGYDFGELAPASLSGSVYLDADNDGVFDVTEVGVAGVTVTLTGIDDLGVLVIAVTTTDAAGNWAFTGLRPSDAAGYTVIETQPPGLLDGGDAAGPLGGDATTVNDEVSGIVVGPGEVASGNTFGELEPATIAGTVYADADNDGILDPGEAGIAAVTVTLTGTDDLGAAVSVTTTTDAAGAYIFTDLRPGTYTVTETQPAGFLDGIDSVGSLGGTLGDDVISAIPVAPGDTGTGYDFGELTGASVGGAVFVDADNDGVLDAGEAGIAGVTVTLTGTDDLGNTVTLSTTTAADGSFTFTDLRPGTYEITETQPAGVLDGIDTAGSLGGVVGADTIGSIVVQDGDTGTGYLFAELEPVSLGGAVYEDVSNDGVLDAGEAGIAGVTITLTGTDDLGNAVILTTVTAADGTYSFTDLRPGTYEISETQPAAFLDGIDTAGSLGGVVGADTITAIPASPGDTGTGYTFGELPTASISGAVFDDADNDGVVDAGEAGIAGVTITLTGTDDLGNAVSLTTTTAADGTYTFIDLRPGTYTVTETQPAGFLDGIDSAGSAGGVVGADTVTSIVLGAGVPATGYTFAELTPSTLSGAAYSDADNDGVFDAAETGIAGVTVTLAGTDDLGAAVLLTATTDATGAYSFTDLRPGTYTVTETQPAGFFDGIDTIGTQGGSVSANDELTISLAPATTGTGNLFGELEPAAIGDYVWLDIDDDGVQDPAEGIDGLTVNLYAADGVTLLATTVTAAGGAYSFGNLAPFASYVVEVVPPPGGVFTSLPGTDDTDDSDVDAGGRVTVVPVFGDNFDAADAGLVPASLTGMVWLDENGDGVSDASEPALPGVTVNLYDSSGVLVATTTTAADGGYSFSGLLPGDYTVEVVYPGASFAAPGADSDVDPVTGTAAVTLGSGPTADGGDAGVLAALIGDLVWLDLDGDGTQGPTEPGVAGVTVTLLDASGVVVASTVTAADGTYGFVVPPGDYEVVVTPPGGGVFTATGVGAETSDSDVDPAGSTGVLTFGSGDAGDAGDAGVLPADISGVVWLDLDADGLNDDASPLAGVTVNLYDDLGVVVATTITAVDGSYSFPGLVPGDYTVEVVSPDGAPFTTPGGDSDVDPATGTAAVAATGSHVVDAGVLPGFIGGVLWLDLDGDGVNDGEPGASGVTVTLLDATGAVVATTVTDGAGQFAFGPLPAGDYTVVVDETAFPAGTTQTFDPDGVNDGTAVVTLPVGGNVGDVDFGYQPPATVTGILFEDLDGDGVQDPGEPGLAGVDVIVTAGDGTTIVVTTGADGSYAAAVTPGTVTVTVDETTLPPGAVSTTGNATQTVVAPAGEVVATDPVGYQLVSDVSGLIWNDADGDGVRDAGEPGIQGVTVTLIDASGSVVATAVTGPAGGYVFLDVTPGDYTVVVDTTTLPSGTDFPTFDLDGSLDNATSITVTADGDTTGVDFGYRPAGSIGGTLWHDVDGDGVREPGDPGLAGIPVTVTWLGPDGLPGGGDDVAYATVTGADGSYTVDGLPAGSYAITFDETAVPPGLAVTSCAAATPSVGVAATTCDSVVELGAGDDLTGVDVVFTSVVDLAVTVSSDVTTAATGDDVTFTVTVTNDGPGVEGGPIQVTVVIGDGMMFVGGGGDGWTFEVVGDGVVVFTYTGTLPPGAELTFPIDVVVASAEGDLSLTATVTGVAVDTDVTNNTVTVSIGILPFTGVPADNLVRLGLAMLLGGVLVLLVTGQTWGGRRRRRDV